jgi:hypothetical protein
MTTCPHCLGGNCIHCGEHRAELSFQRRRSRLTEDERRALGLFVRPLRVRQKAPPTAPVHQTHRMVPVLPANFSL